MHRITGDGYIVQNGKRLFADEDLPSRYATQVTHQWANAVQEEIANVIEGAGATLHDSDESITQMNQLLDAVKKLSSTVSRGLFGRGYIDGLCMSSPSGNPDFSTVITVHPGACTMSDGSVAVLTSPITKDVILPWQKGSGETVGASPNELVIGETGAVLEVFLIMNPSTGEIDVAIDIHTPLAIQSDSNIIAAGMNNCYRRIGTVFYRDSNMKLMPFRQFGDRFTFGITPSVHVERPDANWFEPYFQFNNVYDQSCLLRLTPAPSWPVEASMIVVNNSATHAMHVGHGLNPIHPGKFKIMPSSSLWVRAYTNLNGFYYFCEEGPTQTFDVRWDGYFDFRGKHEGFPRDTI